MIKSIFLGGGVTTHCYELAKSISRYYEVWAIILPTKQKREERIPSELSANVNLIKCENIDDIYKIISKRKTENSLHINSALKQGSLNNKALKILCQKGYNVFSLPQESFQTQGLKGKINAIKWFLYLHFTYRRKIKGYGLTGLNAQRTFKRMLVSPHKLFQFSYITFPTKLEVTKKNNIIRFIYVGAIDKRKNIIPFVEYMQNYSSQQFIFDIYGSWTLDKLLIKKISNSTNIYYHGKRNYKEVRNAMLNADYLILPSLYDGWGAVVNEGLQSGCKVLVSKDCGASIFPLIDSHLGYVFDGSKLSSLNGIMKQIFIEGPLSIENRQSIQKWANNKIHPDIIGDYLNHVIQYYFSSAPHAIAPWLDTSH